MSSRGELDIVMKLQLCLVLLLQRRKISNEVVLDGKHHVVCQVVAFLVKDLGNQGSVSLFLGLDAKDVR